MTNFLRLSEHPSSQKWLAQFRNSKDRALAAQLLNQLKLVSNREFESGIEQALTQLQARLQARIAVYPVAPPIPGEIAGYDPFTGGIPRNKNVSSREIGRRRQYGSEDRVGHLLTKLQERFKNNNNSISIIECGPTLQQLKTQGIRHIVLVDDICGSGTRIEKYWRSIPRHIKSLLSYKRYELWVVFYAITPKGKIVLGKAMPNFPLSNLITALPETDLRDFLTPDLRTLCTSYARQIGMESSGLGYRGSASHVVFEHGCPNNLPGILWANHRGWSGLFPNRSIPAEMHSCFDEDGTERALEVLWRVNQPGLALGLLDALDHAVPMTAEQRMVLAMLGLRLRGVSEDSLAVKLFLTNEKHRKVMQKATEMGVYDTTSAQVTQMGRECLSRFRDRFGPARRSRAVVKSPENYYPQQCEGELRELGKTDRSNGSVSMKGSVPMETQ
ncbi:MAG: hypothetical protein H7839_20410 [Magnetococcus sp. YQC-5]